MPVETAVQLKVSAESGSVRGGTRASGLNGKGRGVTRLSKPQEG